MDYSILFSPCSRLTMWLMLICAEQKSEHFHPKHVPLTQMFDFYDYCLSHSQSVSQSHSFMSPTHCTAPAVVAVKNAWATALLRRLQRVQRIAEWNRAMNGQCTAIMRKLGRNFPTVLQLRYCTSQSLTPGINLTNMIGEQQAAYGR